MKYTGLLLLTLLAGCTFMGCDNDPANPSFEAEICRPVDYGNGVYYFPCYGADFGKSLASWRTGRQIVSITPADVGGGTHGYFVVTVN